MIQGTIRVPGADPSTGVPCVRVSNGREVVTVDAEGAYQLPRQDEDRFVFLTVPSGFASDGPSYQKLGSEDTYDFDLRSEPSRAEEEFSFVQITDTHMSVDGSRSASVDLRQDLDAILQEVGDRAAFVVATGDLTNRGTGEEFAAYLDAVEGFQLPIYPCIGNHDDNDPEALGDHFTDALGPTYYSFDYGPAHFVVYDVIGPDWRVPDHQDVWLRADLDAIPAATPIVMLLHYPWGRSFFDRFQNDRIVASFSGHWHCARVYRDGQTVHYNTPTLCFGGIDQSPRAYRFCTYQGGKITSEIRALDSKTFSGISFRPDLRSVSKLPPQSDEGLGPSSEWAQFRGGPGRTGRSDSGPRPPLVPVWRTPTGGALHMGSPVLTGDTLVLGTQNEDVPGASCVVGLDALDGGERWRSSTETSIKLSPASENGRCFVVTVTGEVIALDAGDGNRHWSYQLGDASERWVYSSPLVSDGRLYVGMSSHFVSLNARNGELIWMRDDFGTTDWIASYPSPAGFEDVVVVAFYGQPTNLVVLDKMSGKTIWKNDEDKAFRVSSTPVVAPDGTVYVISGRSLVRAFDVRTGTPLWESSLDRTRCAASPALSAGRLYVPTGDGTLHALDVKSGRVVWNWEAQEGLASFSPYVRGGKGQVSSPAVTDRFVFFGSADGHLYALNADSGEVAWSHNLGTPMLSSPVVSGNGLWIGACDGTVNAFSGETTRLTGE